MACTVIMIGLGIWGCWHKFVMGGWVGDCKLKINSKLKETKYKNGLNMKLIEIISERDELELKFEVK